MRQSQTHRLLGDELLAEHVFGQALHLRQVRREVHAALEPVLERAEPAPAREDLYYIICT